MEELKRCFTVYTNAHTMLIERGYVHMLALSIQATTFDEFFQRFFKNGYLDKNLLNFVRVKENQDKSSQYISVYFCQDESLRKKHIVKIIEKLKSSKMSHAMVIYPKALTPSAKKKFTERDNNCKIEVFSEDEMFLNITKHQSMPKVHVLTKLEKETFLIQNRLTDTQLACIQSSDPLARYYGLRKRDVIRLIRKSDSAGLYATFRVCS